MHPTKRPALAARAALVTVVSLLTTAVAVTGTITLSAAPVAASTTSDLHLVTLRGAGTAGSSSFLPTALRAVSMRAEQDRTLDLVDAPAPVYRWTTALNGYAVRLTPDQVETLTADPAVVSVERNEIRPLTSVPDAGLAEGLADGLADGLAGSLPGAGRPQTGGAGTVIGIIDTGLAPESPLFAQVRHQREAAGFSGACPEVEDWTVAECNGKVAGARWYVEGFGVDHLRATSSLSPRDTDGHGTQMASIAAGNSGVPVTVGGERLGALGGLAPEAQVAVYKACWGAPDPDDDGCSTADLVAAIDGATEDGVDVISLSVGGPATIDTVERALLGAAESGIVVTAAAGNGGADSLAAHASPWVTTVGGTVGVLSAGRVVVPQALRTKRVGDLSGVMLSRQTIGPAPVVVGGDVAADWLGQSEARVCAPGSLDAASVAGTIVVCERGQVGRTDKSRAVALADGVGMVLVNRRRGSVDLDIHSVPTIHLDLSAGARLLQWVREHPTARLTLRPLGRERRPERVATLSAGGDLGAGVLKPDVVAPATAVLGALPTSSDSDDWGFVNGTSAATAYTAGVAATLLARGEASASEVRSALSTTASPVGRASALRTGAGRVRPDRVRSPGLGYLTDAGDYRDWLDGELEELNTPSAVITAGTTTITRTVTNVGNRRLYFSSSARGFRSRVAVTPAAVRLGPGESATYTLTIERPSPRLDDGYVVWRGARGSVTRMPVVIGR